MAFPMKPEIKFVEKASRLELFIRLILCFVYGIIAEIWAIFVLIVWVLQWFYILFTGRRHKSFENFTKGFWRYWVRVVAYCLMLTDERPPISGQA
ncbi:DUF4389 domain-containing protein [Candidatus Woesearchaeota archaeon]|jgi:hypothetical protein|nr:DUF4389 domain-containing protein [Candidatus Woesearchaeota archaeon]MBT7402431.1 DUF4389 domain-containing protein [Candidatus Woesearchaeota archaeon]